MGGGEEEGLMRDDSGLLTETVTPRSNDWCKKLTKTLCLSLAFFTLGLCIAIPGPTLLDLGDQVGATTSEMMMIFASRSVGYLLGAILGGVLFDCFDKQLLLFCTLLVSSVATIAIPWSLTLIVMATMFALQGITMGVLDTGGNIFCIRIWGKNSAPYMQTLHFAFGIGAFIAPLLSKPFLSNDLHLSGNTSILQGNIPVSPFLHDQLSHNRSREIRSVDLDLVLDSKYNSYTNHIENSMKFRQEQETDLIEKSFIESKQPKHVLLNNLLTLNRKGNDHRNSIHNDGLNTLLGTQFLKASDYKIKTNKNTKHTANIDENQIEYNSRKIRDVGKAISTNSDPNNTDSVNSISITTPQQPIKEKNSDNHNAAPEATTSKPETSTLNSGKVESSKTNGNLTTAPDEVNANNQTSKNKTARPADTKTDKDTTATTVASTEEIHKKPVAASDNKLTAKADGSDIKPHLDAHKKDDETSANKDAPDLLSIVSTKDLEGLSGNTTIISSEKTTANESTTKNPILVTENPNLNVTTQINKPNTTVVPNTKDNAVEQTQTSTNDSSKAAPTKPQQQANATTAKPSSAAPATQQPTTTTTTTKKPTTTTTIPTTTTSTTSTTTTKKPTTTTTSTTTTTTTTTIKPTTTAKNTTTITTTTTTPKPVPETFKPKEQTTVKVIVPKTDTTKKDETATDKTHKDDKHTSPALTSAIVNTTKNVSVLTSSTVKSTATTTIEVVSKPSSTVDSFFNKAVNAVKNISKIQFAYLIIGLTLFANSVMFCALYCKDKRGFSTINEFEDFSRMSGDTFCFKGTLLTLLGLFFFCYVGLEVTYGALVSTFTVKFNHWPKTQGAVVAAIFWGSLATGRGFSIFIARCCGPTVMLCIDFVFMIVGSLVLSVGIYFYEKLLWLGTLLLGLGMSSVFPAGILWAESYFRLTGKSTAVFVMGSALGQIVVPIITGYMFEKMGDGMVLMQMTLALSVIGLVIFIAMQCVALKMGHGVVKDRGSFLPLEDDEDDNMEMNLVHFDKTQSRRRVDRRGYGDTEYRTLISDLDDD